MNQYDAAGNVSDDTRDAPVAEPTDTHPETESDGVKKEDQVKANDPLTEGRDFSREDEDMDAYKKK
ncbi:MAG: hypothetical protein U5K84_11805 [Alkalibacterium sp.]|nr:hypothetical protein [Alkalibacterium sp.]